MALQRRHCSEFDPNLQEERREKISCCNCISNTDAVRKTLWESAKSEFLVVWDQVCSLFSEKPCMALSFGRIRILVCSLGFAVGDEQGNESASCLGPYRPHPMVPEHTKKEKFDTGRGERGLFQLLDTFGEVK